MITTKVAQQSFWQNKVEGYLFFLEQDFAISDDLKKVETYYPHVQKVLARHKFTGKYGQSFALTAVHDDRLVQFLFFGIGKLDKPWHEELERVRRVMGSAVHMLKKRDIKDAVICVPAATSFNIERDELVKQLAIAAGMAAYEFVTFKSEKKDKEWQSTLLFDVGDASAHVEKKIAEAGIVTEAINQTRNLIDMPPNIVTPTYVSDYAQGIAKKYGLKCTVFGREKAEELGMGGFCAVDIGSEQEGKFIILEYKASNAEVPTIVLVGKGVTFDTGGISLKPSASMKGMKYDMASASSVIGALQVIAQLKPEVNVVGITPMVENMPSGRASRQDDIVTFMNGKTAEIESTDAEGRLILADALCYAEKMFKPSVIIDAATLTGACLVALGHYFSALMTHDDDLAACLQKAAKVTGDRIWPLPLHDDFKKAIKSAVADITNTGKRSYGGQTITAGWFLRNFVKKTPWAHLDIAGTASDVPGISYVGKGATGAGLRLFVEYIMNYGK